MYYMLLGYKRNSQPFDTVILFTNHIIVTLLYDLVPKGAQEKRTEVLENKVDRMWVSNAFFEWTREVIHQWREKAVLLFVPEKLDFQCDLWQYVEHYIFQQAHIIVLLIMQLTAKTQVLPSELLLFCVTENSMLRMVCCNG